MRHDGVGKTNHPRLLSLPAATVQPWLCKRVAGVPLWECFCARALFLTWFCARAFLHMAFRACVPLKACPTRQLMPAFRALHDNELLSFARFAEIVQHVASSHHGSAAPLDESYCSEPADEPMCRDDLMLISPGEGVSEEHDESEWSEANLSEIDNPMPLPRTLPRRPGLTRSVSTRSVNQLNGH